MMTESHQPQEVRLISSFITDTYDSSNQSIKLVTESDKSIRRKKPEIIPRKHIRNQVKDRSIIVEHLQTSENQCTTNSSIYLLNLESQKSSIFESSDENSCTDSKRNTGGISNKLLISHEVKISPYDASSYCISRSLRPSSYDSCKEQLTLSPLPPPPPYDGLDLYEENPELDENDKGVVSPLNLRSDYKDTVVSKDKCYLSDLYNKHDRVKDKTSFQSGGHDKQDVFENNIHVWSDGYNKLDVSQDNSHVQSDGFSKCDVPKGNIFVLSDGYDMPYNVYHKSISPGGTYCLNEYDRDKNVLSADIRHTLDKDCHENVIPKNNTHAVYDGYNKHDTSKYTAQAPSGAYYKPVLPKDNRHILSNGYDKHNIYTDNTQVPYNVIHKAVVSPGGTCSLNEGTGKNVSSDTIHALYDDYHENVISNDNTHALYDDFIKNISPGSYNNDYYEVLPDNLYNDGYRKVLSSDHTHSLSDNCYKSTCKTNDENYYRHASCEDIISRDNTHTVYDNYNNYPQNIVSQDNSYFLNDDCSSPVSSNKNRRCSVNDYTTIVSLDNAHSLCLDARPSVKEQLYSNSNQNYISPDSAQKWYMDFHRNKTSSVGSETLNVEPQRNDISLTGSQVFPVDYSENNTLQNERIFTRLPKSFPSSTFSEYSPIENDVEISSSFLDHPETTNMMYNHLNGNESRDYLPIQITTTQECPENVHNVYMTDSANQMNKGDNTNMRFVKPSKWLIHRKSYKNGEEAVVPSDGYGKITSPVFAEQFDYDENFRNADDTQQSINSVGQIIMPPNKISVKNLQDYNSQDEHINDLLANSPLSSRFPRLEMSDKLSIVENSSQNENDKIINPLKEEGKIVDNIFYLDSPENKRRFRDLPSKNSFDTFSGCSSHSYDKGNSRNMGKQETKISTSWNSSKLSCDDVSDVSNKSFQDKRIKHNSFYLSQQQCPLHYEDVEGSFPLSVSSPKVNSDYYILSPLAASTPEGVLGCSEKYKENTQKQYGRRYSGLVTDESGFVDCSTLSVVSDSADCHRNSEKLSTYSSSNSEEYEFNNIDVFPAYVDNYENYMNSPDANVSVDHRKNPNKASFSCTKETGFENYANIEDFSISRISNKYDYDDGFTREKPFSYPPVRSPRDYVKENPNCKRIPTKQEHISKADLYMNSQEAASYINSLRISPGRAYESRCNSPAKISSKEMSAIEKGFLKLSEALENTFRNPPSKITFASDRAKRNFCIGEGFPEKISFLKTDGLFDENGYEDSKADQTGTSFKLKNFLKKKKH